MSMGRVLVSLIFREGNKEITVRTIQDLKEVFKDKFYSQLVTYLHNGRLEKFFYALGMDNIKETIEKLKKENLEDIEILNKVAELLKFEPISKSILNAIKFAKNPNLLEEISNLDQVINLSLNKYFLKAEEIKLEGSKTFKRESSGNTEIEIDANVIKGEGSLVFENVTLKIKNEVYFEGFREIEFRNVNISSEKPIKFINTSIKMMNCDIAGGLYIENSSLDAKNTQFHDSSENGIYCLNSSLNLTDCKAFRNGNKEGSYRQIWIGNSVANIENTEVYESINATGLYSESSKLSLIGCKFYKNFYHGMNIKEKTELNMKDCKVFENGNKEDSYSQVFIESSVANIENTEVYNSVNSYGLFSANSEISLFNCKFYKNFLSGVQIGEQTELNMKNCEVFENGNKNKPTPQIGVLNSVANIESTEVYESVNADGLHSEGSKVLLLDCKFYKNVLSGIFLDNQTELNMKNCEVFKNGDKEKLLAQIVIANSRATIEYSRIYEPLNPKSLGIYILRGSVLLYKVKTYGNLVGVYRESPEYASIYDCEIRDGII